MGDGPLGDDHRNDDASSSSPWRWLKWVAFGIVVLPVGLLITGLYSLLGSSINLLYVLLAIGILVGVTLFTLRWLSELWLLLTLPVTFVALIPSMKFLVKLNKETGFV